MTSIPRRIPRPGDWSVRVRTGMASALALAPVLVLASVVALTVQRHDLTDSAALVAEEQARTQARDLAPSGADGSTEPGLSGSLGGEETLLQVVGPDGVEDSSPGLEDSAPLAPAPTGSAITRAEVRAVVERESDRFVAVGVPIDGTDRYVVAVRSLETVDEAAASTTRLLVFGVPVLVLLVAALSWALAGRALAPVERLRRTAADITTAGSGRRLPEVSGRDEVAGLATTLNEMLERLDASSRSQRQFVADASHELRSPVATIRTLLEVDARAPSDPDDLRADLLAETARLERLVTALLALARRDATDPQVRPQLDEPVRMRDLVTEEAARSRQHPVGLELHGDPVVGGDHRALAVLLTNLLDNADRYATSDVVVTLDVDASGTLARLTVVDDGPGIGLEDRERVFDRFVRLDEARTRDAGGAGLGLAIARTTAEDHGGTLRCVEPDIARGPGARMELLLPVAGTAPDQVTRRSRA